MCDVVIHCHGVLSQSHCFCAEAITDKGEQNAMEIDIEIKIMHGLKSDLAVRDWTFHVVRLTFGLEIYQIIG